MTQQKCPILVFLRQTCDPRPPAQLTADGYGVRQRGLRRFANPADLAALEQALRLAESEGGTVTVVACGPPELDEELRLALALGAERVIRVCDKAAQGGDVAAAARLTGRIVEILDPALVFSGSRLLDRGDEPTLALAAARLGLPCLTAVLRLKRSERRVEVLRKSDRGARQTVRATLPCAVLFEADSCSVRYPTQQALLQAAAAPIECWGLAELGLPAAQLGAAAALLGRGPCALPRPNPRRVVTPAATLPAFERILALLSGGLKPREGKLHRLSAEQTVEQLLGIFAAAGLLGGEKP